MHGRVCEKRNNGCRRHMWTASTRLTASLNANGSSCLSLSSSTSFCKDGRKISVGDCALFRPPRNSPPFVGIIRLVTGEKVNKLKLGVSWLYRPGELKLGKGILLEAAPNEIFYSFHEDEIPAASLLHPCKVAFLSQGVELPSGISSFVCRRVYDISKECLWWLTDQVFVDDQQQEIDQLLCKTRSEMHATLQQGGRSPKLTNSPTTSQLKPGTDGTQNNAFYPSHGKGRKRERMDNGSEPVKRERSSRIDDSGSVPLRTESGLKSEIVKITEKGGLVDSQAVEKLVQLMQPEKSEKKIDLVCRSMLAGVVAATDKFDCLSRFVQRGLPVFDEWLQEVHKGKIGDGSSPRDSDRSIEDFLLVLLRALDKLPVNLNALKTCNIGKSVNHLRSHKNSEIQKKARSLVDTWKKRVEAEMDAKSGSNQGASWPGRLRQSEVSPGGRHSGGSADAMKMSATHPHASKSASVKVQVESSMKSAATSPSSTRSAPSPGSGCTGLKDGQQRNTGAGGVSDVPLMAAKDEKSSSSSQSHNNSQSCSSEHAKTGAFSGKEDARSSTAGSMTVNKNSGGSSRHRKSMNGFQGSASAAANRETGSSRSSSSQRNATSEKLSQSTMTSEKIQEVTTAEGCSNKLIVKFSNHGRSPAQSVSGGSFEDPAAVNSRASSPVLSEKHDQFDRTLREKNDTYRSNFSSDVNAESWQSNDFKDILTGSDEGGGSPSIIPDDGRCRTVDDSRKLAAGVSKTTSPSSANELKSGKRHGGSLSSMNALVESCVRYSETNSFMAGADDVGMNLLASVAADEISKSRNASPPVSPLSNTVMIGNSSAGNHTKLITSSIDPLPHEQRQAIANDTNAENSEHDKQRISSSGLQSTDSDNNDDSKPGELDESSNSEIEDLQRLVDECLESNESEDVVASTALPTTGSREKMLGDNACEGVDDRKADITSDVDHGSTTDKHVSNSVLTECNAIDNSLKVESVAVEHSVSDFTGGCKKEQRNQTIFTSPEMVKKEGEDTSVSSGFGKGMIAANADNLKTEKIEEMVVNHLSQPDRQKNKNNYEASLAVMKQITAGMDSLATNSKVEPIEVNLESTDVNGPRSGGLAPRVSPKGAGDHRRQKGSRVSGADGDEAEECTSVARDVSSGSVSANSGIDARVEFDLNEGLNGDDVRNGDSNNFAGSVSLTSSALQPVNASPFPATPLSGGLPASITIAAAAKGPFVPPEDLLRSKGTIGWKGSAATSAFRPAEPRKVQELGMNNTSTSDTSTSGKQIRLPLDIDLNVPDERLLEDLASQRSPLVTTSTSGMTSNLDPSCTWVMGSGAGHSSRGLDLDLNKVDDPTDVNNHTISSSHRLDMSLQQVKLSSCGPRDFDLNDGPTVDDVNPEPPMMFSQHARSSLPSQPNLSGLRVNGENMANFSSWFPAANTYPAVSIPPTILQERGEQTFPVIPNGGPQRLLGPTTGTSSYASDVYRGPVLSSSPAVPFQSTTFQYPVFPFGTSFPFPSATFSGGSTTYLDSSSGGRLCFPSVSSQVLPTAVAVPSNYPRPYVVSLPNGGSNGVSDNVGKWFRSGLDLNTGPGGHETDARDEMAHVSRQLTTSGLASLKEDQARMLYQMSAGIVKRKEPEGGWDGFKQSWQ